jgi:hypothetical protein
MGVIQLIGQGGLVPAPDPFSQYLVTALPFNHQSQIKDQSHIIKGSGSPATVTDTSVGYAQRLTITPDNSKFYGFSLRKPYEVPADSVNFHSSELIVDTGVANTIGSQALCWEGWFFTESFNFNGAERIDLLYSMNSADAYGPTYTQGDNPAIAVGSDTYSDVNARRGIRIYNQPNGNFLGNTGSNILSPNTWHHIAYTRSGTTGRVFVDGTLRLTVTDSKSYTGYVQDHLAALNRSLPFGMYFQDIRFYVGTAKYTSNFTVPGPMFL